MFKGSYPALITPFTNGELDLETLKKLVEWHIGEGTNGFVPVGTTGESPTLSHAEHEAVVEEVVRAAAGRVPVIAGAGSNNTLEAIHLAQHAEKVGADAILVVTPYYNKPTQEGLYQHFAAIAKAVPIPQILYNVPGRTAVDMLPETTARLAAIDNIVGIKEATGTLARIQALLDACPADFAIMTGDDATAMESILAGARADISVTANVVPREMHEMCAAALRGDRAAAEAIESRIGILHQTLFVESNPIPVKWALAEMGKMQAGIRLPLTVLNEQYHNTLRESLKKAGAL